MLVGLSDIGGFYIGFEVIVAIGEAEAALPELEDYFVAVLVVLSGPIIEEAAYSRCLEPVGCLQQARDIMDGTDKIQFGPEGFEALAVDIGRIHAAGPEVADLLADAAGGGVFGCGLLADGLQSLIDVFLHQVANAPFSFGGGDGGTFDPPAVGVLKEVGGRADGRVEIGGQEIGSGLFFLLVAGSQEEEGESEDAVFFHVAIALVMQIWTDGTCGC